MVWDNTVQSPSSTATDKTAESKYSSLNSKEGKGKDTLQVDDFLNLLCTQLKYQDPLEPTDNTQYIAQMATFTQVQATTDMLDTTTRKMATSLVGQDVIIKTDQNKNGYVTGKVDAWEENSNGIFLCVNGGYYDINDLENVIDKDFYDNFIKDYSAAQTVNDNN